MIVLATVWAFMVATPVVLVWWSCRVAPPTKPPRRYVTLLDLFRAAVVIAREFDECRRRVEATFQATRDDIARLRAVLERKP